MPFVVVSYTVWFVLSQVFPWQIGGLVLRPGFGMYLRYMLFALVGAAAISFVFAFMAGVFKGRNSFAHALAATSLAFIPGYLGNALSPLPIAGVLLSLGGGIYSLVLLWRILPAYLELPDDGRVLHFISSLVLTLVLATALAMLIGVGRAGMQVSGVDGDQDLASAVKRALHDENESERGGASPFSGMERSARIMEDADDDTYQPPRDGRLGEAQVQQVIANLQRTRELREAEAKRLERLAEDMEKEEPVAERSRWRAIRCFGQPQPGGSRDGSGEDRRRQLGRASVGEISAANGLDSEDRQCGNRAQLFALPGARGSARGIAALATLNATAEC